jgi:putative ABC transport system substrate-binding protein
MSDRRRREFLTLLGGAAAWPLTARAQQREPMRRVGVLMTLSADDVIGQTRVAALLQGLGGRPQSAHRAALKRRESRGHPQTSRRTGRAGAGCHVANGSAAAGPLLEATRSVPIVFAIVPDPVGAGYVDSLARPGGNATGFTSFEYGIGGKWLELLKEIGPGLTQAAVIRDPAISAGLGQWGELCYQPPVRNSPRSRRFSSATRSRSTFCGKRTGNGAWFTPDGTIRRSFSRTAAGKLAGVEGWILPPGRGER